MRRKATLRSDVPAQPLRKGHNRQNKPNRPCFKPAEASNLILLGLLPANSLIIGNLSFEAGSEPIFPPNTHIRGNLSVVWCGAGTKLASGLTVDGIADFTMTPIKTLPKRFAVKQVLCVNNTLLSWFPSDMKVGWQILLDKDAPQAMKARAASLDCLNAKRSKARSTRVAQIVKSSQMVTA